jgi:hypothetical protein
MMHFSFVIFLLLCALGAPMFRVLGQNPAMPPATFGKYNFSCNIAIKDRGVSQAYGELDLQPSPDQLSIKISNKLLPSSTYPVSAEGTEWSSEQYVIPFKEQSIKYQFDRFPKNGISTFIRVYMDRHPEVDGRNVNSGEYAAGVCIMKFIEPKK